jgi:hypothetical protein
MVFRYFLCSITIRTNLQKLLDFTPSAPFHTYTGDWWPRSGLGAFLGRVDATSTAITTKKWLWLKQLLTRLTPSPWSASYRGRLCAFRFCPKVRSRESEDHPGTWNLKSQESCALDYFLLLSHVLINHNDLHRLILLGPNRLPQFDYLYTLITIGLFG